MWTVAGITVCRLDDRAGNIHKDLKITQSAGTDDCEAGDFFAEYSLTSDVFKRPMALGQGLGITGKTSA